MLARDFNKVKPSGANELSFKELQSAVTKLEGLLEKNQISTYGTLMKSGASLAGSLRQGEISWLFIDEAQDMNGPQGAFVGAVQDATGCKLFVIADDDQGIYKFRGASTAYLDGFLKRGKPAKRFPMEQNFRSTQQIVKVCLEWIAPNWTVAGKKLHSIRDGLPVVILKHKDARNRAYHAKLIMEEAESCNLLEHKGEVCILGMSPKMLDQDVTELSDDPEEDPIEDKIHFVRDMPLEDNILKMWLDLLDGNTAPGDWHHALWDEFIKKVKALYPEGCPGLNDLYSALEVVRRLAPDEAPNNYAVRLRRLAPMFLGDRPDPDYEGDKWNYVSFHSSKGMEFPVVWVTSGAYTYSVSERDKSEGQPNPTSADKEKIAREEKIRLLYVAMSRASDLLMISAPWSKKEGKEKDFLSLVTSLGGVKTIYTDKEAADFAATLCKRHRNPDWERPKRYRVESYTSYTRQILPGVTREVEIPRKTECPMPQSEGALVGDQFHRIMHLLCLEPELLREYLSCGNHSEVVKRVVSRNVPARLLELVNLYFGDITNKPYDLLVAGNCRSEVPFSVVKEENTDSPTEPPDEYLVKGFIDFVRFTDAGNPDLILDYKIGVRPTDPVVDAAHTEQLEFYRSALATTYSVDPSTIEIANYYVSGQEWVKR